MKVLITDTEFPDIELERNLYQEAGIECVAAQCRTEEDVIAASAGCFGLLVQYATVGAKVFAARPEIRIVSRYGAGLDTLDIVAAKRRGVWIANSPDCSVGEVATHALSMTLALLRHLVWLDRDIRQGRWNYFSSGEIRRVGNMTLGLLGLGRIGKRMAYLARNCFKRVIAWDPYILDSDFPPYVERQSTVEQLFGESNAISVHVPLTDETRGMVSAKLLKRVTPSSVLVNTSRSGVINIDDLLAALDARQLDGAALDVLPVEPPPMDSPLLAHPRVLLTPHAAYYSAEAQPEVRRKAARNIIEWVRTGRPTYVVVAGRNVADAAEG